MFIFFACTKEKGMPPSPSPVLDETQTIKFIFVNRNGFRTDSTGNSINDTVLGGVCLESKYYNPTTNESMISSTCYNRNFPSSNFPLSD